MTELEKLNIFLRWVHYDREVRGSKTLGDFAQEWLDRDEEKTEEIS